MKRSLIAFVFIVSAVAAQAEIKRADIKVFGMD
jgi:hypothetical protein